jgi:hypothetical protein
MDQRRTIGTSLTLERPIHRACVVPGCWCGSTATAGGARSAGLAIERPSDARTARRIEAAATSLTDIAWRCVSLPVV